jgi:hypothetical protein
LEIGEDQIVTAESLVEFRQFLYYFAGAGGMLCILVGLGLTVSEFLRVRGTRKSNPPAVSGKFQPETLEFAYAVTPGIALVVVGLLTTTYLATTPAVVDVEINRTSLPSLGAVAFDSIHTAATSNDDAELVAFCKGVRGEVVTISGHFADGDRGARRVLLLEALNAAAQGAPGPGAQAIIVNALRKGNDLGSVVRFLVVNAIVEPDVSRPFCDELGNDEAVSDEVRANILYTEIKALLSNSYAE